MLLPMVYLCLELGFHRVSVTGKAVTDTTWRTTSTATGTDESYTVLDGPLLPRLGWSQHQQPSLMVWTGTDGRRHRLSFQWFRRRDVYAIIAAVQAL